MIDGTRHTISNALLQLASAAAVSPLLNDPAKRPAVLAALCEVMLANVHAEFVQS